VLSKLNLHAGKTAKQNIPSLGCRRRLMRSQQEAFADPAQQPTLISQKISDENECIFNFSPLGRPRSTLT
jgi:hypothetical protein